MVLVEGAPLLAPSADCRPRPRGSASSWRAPANSRPAPGTRARCRSRRCRTGPRRRSARASRCRCRTARNRREAWRAAIQLTLPRRVLISPLWATMPVGMRELPGREGVGGEALVHEGERALEALVRKVVEIGAELASPAPCPCRRWCGRQRDRIVAGGARVLEVVDRVRDDLAGDEQAALERVLRRRMPLPWPTKICRCRGSVALTLSPRSLEVDRHVAPAEEGRPSSAMALRRRSSSTMPQPSASRGMNKWPTPYSPGSGRAMPRLGALLPRRRRAGSARGCRSRRPILGSAPTAPRWSRLCRICRPCCDDGVGLAVLHVGDEADAAGILLVRRIVEPLRRRQGRIAGRRAGTGLHPRSVSTVRSSRPRSRLAGGPAKGRGTAACFVPPDPASGPLVSCRGLGVSARARTSRASPAVSAGAPVPPAFCGRRVEVSRFVVRRGDMRCTLPKPRAATRGGVAQMGQHRCPNHREHCQTSSRHKRD